MNLFKKKKVKPTQPKKEKQELLSDLQRVAENLVDKKINISKDHFDLLEKSKHVNEDKEKLILDIQGKNNGEKFLIILQSTALSHIISSTFTGNGDRVYDDIDRGVMTEKLIEVIKRM